MTATLIVKYYGYYMAPRKGISSDYIIVREVYVFTCFAGLGHVACATLAIELPMRRVFLLEHPQRY